MSEFINSSATSTSTKKAYSVRSVEGKLYRGVLEKVQRAETA